MIIFQFPSQEKPRAWYADLKYRRLRNFAVLECPRFSGYGSRPAANGLGSLVYGQCQKSIFRKLSAAPLLLHGRWQFGQGTEPGFFKCDSPKYGGVLK